VEGRGIPVGPRNHTATCLTFACGDGCVTFIASEKGMQQSRSKSQQVAANRSRLEVSLASDKMSTSNPRQAPVSSAAFWWLWSRDGVFKRLQRRGSRFLRCCVSWPARVLHSQGPPTVLPTVLPTVVGPPVAAKASDLM
jgi:hypothetical protein